MSTAPLTTRYEATRIVEAAVVTLAACPPFPILPLLFFHLPPSARSAAPAAAAADVAAPAPALAAAAGGVALGVIRSYSKRSRYRPLLSLSGESAFSLVSHGASPKASAASSVAVNRVSLALCARLTRAVGNLRISNAPLLDTRARRRAGSEKRAVGSRPGAAVSCRSVGTLLPSSISRPCHLLAFAFIALYRER